MTNTPNKNLYLPNRTDNTVDVDTSLSGNFTIIDTELQKNEDELNNHIDNPLAHTSDKISHADGNVKETLDNLTDQVTDIDNRVDEIVSSAGESNIEIVDARGGFPVLRDRLNKVDTKLKGMKLADLATPIYLAHRAARNVYPEASMEGYEACVNVGLDVLEMDVQMTADGALVCIHDDTLDRTMDKTGNLSYITSAGFKSSKIDVLPGWSGTPVFFEDLLRTFKNKVVYAPEIKNSNVKIKLVDTIIEHQLEENVLIQSFVMSDLDYAISKGLPTIFLTNTTTNLPSTIKAYGINYVGLSTAVTDQYVTDCVAAGLNVFMYTVNRRYEHDKYLALGVKGFFSDDPLWVNKTSPVLAWDPYRDQVFSHGMVQPPVDGGGVLGGLRGSFYSPNKFGWSTSTAFRDFCLQGWAGQLSTSFTLDMKINFAALAGTTRWAGIVFCTPNDYFDDQNTSGTLSNGYNLLVRESGSIELFKRSGGTSAIVGSPLATTAITAGQQIGIKVQVTATQIIITRVDTANTMTITDSAFRQGFLHFGRNLSGVTFESVNVIRQ